MNFLQTPARVSEALKMLCEKVSPGNTPEFIQVEPNANFIPDNCYPNVEQLVSERGGSSEFGWAIYEWPRIWFEFQHHAVWRDPEGKLRDQTPRADNEAVALFLPPDLPYRGFHIDTLWFPAGESPEIVRMTEIQKKINDLKAAYFNKVGFTSNMDSESAKPVIALEQEKALILERMRYMPSRNDLCPCMSRKKFKHCHGR